MPLPNVIDCHAHLDRRHLAHDGFALDRILSRCDRFGVKGVVYSLFFEGEALEFPLDRIERVAARHSAAVGVSFGICPPNKAIPSTVLEQEFALAGRLARQLASEGRIVAIGEVGLDYYWPLVDFLAAEGRSNETLDDMPADQRRQLMDAASVQDCLATQQQLFQDAIDLAVETGLSLVVHGRDAYADILRMLETSDIAPDRVMLHCFAGTAEEAVAATRQEHLISIPSSVGYRRQFAEPAQAVDLASMVIETDSPYHSPLIGMWKEAGKAVKRLDPPDGMGRTAIQEWISERRYQLFLARLEERYPGLTFDVRENGQVVERTASEYLVKSGVRRVNESTFVRCAATGLAELRGEDLREVCAVTGANAGRLFPGLVVRNPG